MSRIGKSPIELPENVSVNVVGREVEVKGPKGTLKRSLPRGVDVNDTGGILTVTTSLNTKLGRSLHGTYRALLANMVTGVNSGWSKQLELVGTGYRAIMEENNLSLVVGYSHPVKIEAPEGITFKVEKSQITVEGIDKDAVGLISAKIRSVRPPEPYKGKGIMYVGEIVRRKAGKAAKTVGAA